MGTFRVLCDLKLIMRYVAAYLLAVLGGNASPSAADVKAIISSVGIDAEDDKLAKVIEELKGKNVEELMPREARSWLPFPPVAAVALYPQLVVPRPAVPPRLPKRRKRRRRKSLRRKMTTWDSDSSTKNLSSLHLHFVILHFVLYLKVNKYVKIHLY